jgi:selenoprotein W-related protein
VISELVLVTGDKGIFDVQVDGELIYSKKAMGRHAEPGEVLELFERRLPPGTRRYE